MMRFFIGLFSFALMLAAPFLFFNDALPFDDALDSSTAWFRSGNGTSANGASANVIQLFARSRHGYQQMLVALSRLSPAEEKSVDVFSWRDSEGVLHFSDKEHLWDKSVKNDPVALKQGKMTLKNQHEGRLAFAPAWVFAFMGLMWLVIFLTIQLGIYLINKGLFSFFVHRARRSITSGNEPPRVKVWRDVDIESTEPHHILGISANATVEEIKRAYRNCIQQYHPDRVATMGEDIQVLAERKAAAINEAYAAMLKNKSVKK